MNTRPAGTPAQEERDFVASLGMFVHQAGQLLTPRTHPLLVHPPADAVLEVVLDGR